MGDGPSSYRLPRRIDDLDVQATFAYEPVHFTIGLNQVSFRGADPDLTLQQLTGTIAVRDDNLYLERMVIKTGESALTVGGVIESYLRTPVIKLVTDGHVSLPEVGRIVPALAGYQLHPRLVVNANGTLDRLLLDLDLTTEAGLVRGPLMTDLRSPDFSFAGPLHVERLNLAPILKNPAQRSDITGDVRVDLTLPSNPSSTPVFDRLGGTFTFSGPRAARSATRHTSARARRLQGTAHHAGRGQRASLRRLGHGSRRDRARPRAVAPCRRSPGHGQSGRLASSARVDAGAEARHDPVARRLSRARASAARRAARRRSIGHSSKGRRLRRARSSSSTLAPSR